MCIAPMFIKNKRKDFVRGYHEESFQVDCGHCWQCRLKKKQQWQLRIKEEIAEFKAQGGYTLFVTMTYNPENVPIFEDDYYSFKTHTQKHIKILTHDKNHVERFMHTLNTIIKRNYGIDGMRYFIALEYGKQGTERPHYHALIHVPTSDIKVRDMVEYLKRAWHYGFISFSKESKGGKIVESDKAIAYVSKYINKDFGFFNNPQIYDYLCSPKNAQYDSWSEAYGVYIDSRDYQINQRLQKLEGRLPRVYKSKSYGMRLYDYLTTLPEEDMYKLMMNGIREVQHYNNAAHTIKKMIPQYIMNKILYVYDTDGNRKFSKHWDKFQLFKLQHTKEQAQQINETLTSKGLLALLTDDDVKNMHQTIWSHTQQRGLVFSHLKYDLSKLKTVVDLANYIDHTINKTLQNRIDFLESLVLFRKVQFLAVEEGLTSFDYITNDFSPTPLSVSAYLLNLNQFIISNKLQISSNDKSNAHYVYYQEFEQDDLLFDEPDFEELATISLLLDLVNNITKRKKVYSKIKKEKLISNLKTIMNYN